MRYWGKQCAGYRIWGNFMAWGILRSGRTDYQVAQSFIFAIGISRMRDTRTTPSPPKRGAAVQDRATPKGWPLNNASA